MCDAHLTESNFQTRHALLYKKWIDNIQDLCYTFVKNDYTNPYNKG